MSEQEKIGLEEVLSQAAGNPPAEPTPPEDGATPPEDGAETPPDDGEKTPPEDGEKTPPEDGEDGEDVKKKQPNPIKQVRDQLNTEKATREKIQTAIDRYTEGDYKFKIRDFKTEDGKVDYDAIIEAMDEADNEAKAQAKGISPEVQAEIERIEKEKMELNKQRLQIAMDKELNKLQLSHKLEEGEINNFFKDAMAVKLNPYRWLSQGGSLVHLYQTIYFDRLVADATKKAVEEAEVKWNEAASKEGRAPTKNPAEPTKSKTGKTPDGISLDALLEEAAK